EERLRLERFFTGSSGCSRRNTHTRQPPRYTDSADHTCGPFFRGARAAGDSGARSVVSLRGVAKSRVLRQPFRAPLYDLRLRGRGPEASTAERDAAAAERSADAVKPRRPESART